MDYTQFTPDQVEKMLSAIGVKTIDDLFAPIPASIRRAAPLNIPNGISEAEMLADASAMAKKNHSVTELTCFLGAGAYDHFIPTLVDSLAMQSEFLTAYTPYQAEASQGILQIFYEFQTMMCQLTGMDVSNASMYEGATAAAEAVMIAMSATGRSKVLVAGGVNPDTVFVLKTYGTERGFDVVVANPTDGLVDEAGLKGLLAQEFAAVIVQSPNFYGCVERLDRILPAIKQSGALSIVSTDPISCALLKPPGTFGADVVVGEGQPLGIPLQYGGPYLGFLTCRQEHLRRIPGRVVGMTNDREGRRGFCLALQTREQHIKRERATSNVCTNQGLLATRAAVYLSAMGRKGMRQVAEQCYSKAHYAAQTLAAIPGYKLKFAQAPFFKEFTLQTTRDVDKIIDNARAKGILAGIPLKRFDTTLSDCLLVAVTEKRTKAEIDALAAVLAAS